VEALPMTPTGKVIRKELRAGLPGLNNSIKP
jgi:acetyl-CoA synthetase